MRAWLDSDDNAALVAHREFIDLRTYVFQHGQSEYTRTRFYANGIVLSTEADFELLMHETNHVSSAVIVITIP